jgi:hypothetical protein
MVILGKIKSQEQFFSVSVDLVMKALFLDLAAV